MTHVTQRQWGWVKAFVLIAATLAVYAPVMDGEFVWDDDTHVYENLVIQPGGLYRSWFTTEHHNYWPVSWTAFWLQWKLWGMAPAGYHVVTVLLHLGCALLLWRVLTRLQIPGAWLAGLIFAIHPVNVETGAWITQQKNLLCMLFALVCVERYTLFLAHRKWGVYAVAWLAFLLSLLAKTAAVTIPVVLVGCAWWRDRGLRRRQIVTALPFFALSVLMSLGEVWFQYNRAGAVRVRGDSLLHRLVTAGHVVTFYLGKVFWPAGLSFVYPNPQVRVDLAAHYAPLLLLLVVMGSALWQHRDRGRPVLFGMGYFLVMIFPVLGFLNIYFMRYSWVSDHWQYMAMAGPVALVVGLAARGREQAGARMKAAWSILAAVVCVALGLLAYRRAGVFHDSERLWRDTIARNPSAWMARNNWGLELADRGRLDEAQVHFTAVLALRPDSVEAHLNLASLEMRLKNWVAAAAFLERARRLDADNPDVWYEAGRLALQQEQFDAAEARFSQALQRRPRHAGALAGMGVVQYRRGRHDAARGELEQAVALDPGQAEAWYTLGEIHYAADDMAGAAAAYRAAVSARPALPNGYNSLGVVLIRTGDREGAVAAFRAAVRLNPDDEAARANLERALDEQ